jgi:hypothetical protein
MARTPSTRRGAARATRDVADLDPFWEDLVGGTVRVNTLVSMHESETRTRIGAAYEDILEPYRDANGFELPCVVKVGAAGRTR